MVDGKCTQCTLNCGFGAGNAAICTAENLGCESIGVGIWIAIGVGVTLVVLASLATCAACLYPKPVKPTINVKIDNGEKKVYVKIDNGEKKE
jgi:hypothetical protein